MMNQEVIIKNLITLRKTNNLTQKELALKLSYSDKVISKWERGESLPDINALDKIAKFYQVKVDDLMHEKNIKETKLDNTVNLKEIHVPNRLLIWSMLPLTLFLLSVPFWTDPFGALIVILIYMIVVIAIGVPISHYEWEAYYKGSKIEVKKTAFRTELKLDGKLVDEVTKIIDFGIRLSCRIGAENIKVYVNSVFIAKCKIIID